VNRFPTWKYALIALVIGAAFLYTLPNFFGEAPAVQVSTAKSTVKVDPALVGRVEESLKKSSVPFNGLVLDQYGVRVRFPDTDTQLRAKDVIDHALNPDPNDRIYSVALNLLSASRPGSPRSTRCRCTSASTCVAACISSCRWTPPRRSPSA